MTEVGHRIEERFLRFTLNAKVDSKIAFVRQAEQPARSIYRPLRVLKSAAVFCPATWKVGYFVLKWDTGTDLPNFDLQKIDTVRENTYTQELLRPPFTLYLATSFFQGTRR